MSKSHTLRRDLTRYCEFLVVDYPPSPNLFDGSIAFFCPIGATLATQTFPWAPHVVPDLSIILLFLNLLLIILRF